MMAKIDAGSSAAKNNTAKNSANIRSFLGNPMCYVVYRQLAGYVEWLFWPAAFNASEDSLF